MFYVISTGLLVIVILLALVLITRIRIWQATPYVGNVFNLLGEISFAVMSHENHHFDDKGFIVEGPGLLRTKCPWWIITISPKIGGWVFYIKGLMEPTKYSDRIDVKDFDAEGSVNLGDRQKTLLVEKAEDSANAPLTVKVTVKLRIIHLILFLYVAPKDVIKEVMTLLQGAIRMGIATRTYPQLQAIKGMDGGLSKEFELELTPIVAKIREWGIEVVEDGLVLVDVSQLKEDEDAAAAERRALLESSGLAAEVFAPLLAVKAMSMGITPKLALAELGKTDEGKAEIQAMVREASQAALNRAQGIVPVEVRAGNNPDASILGMAAALFKRSGTNPGSGGESSSGGSSDTGEKKTKTAKELAEERGRAEGWIK